MDSELYLPHTGWFAHEPDDEVATYLYEGWFEYREQAFARLYLRPGDAVLDAGAHFGLYSVICCRAGVAPEAVLALEPNPAVLPFLVSNLERNGMDGVRVRAEALWSRAGERAFYPAGPGRSAYSSLIPEPGAAAVAVQAVTLDEICAADQFALVKIDIEGAELAALEGARETLRAGRLPLVVVECTELNLRRSGAGTRDLFEAIASLGYEVFRFDDGNLQLVPRSYDGPIWFDNLYVTADAAFVNARLRSAAMEQKRIAADILRRGRACQRLYSRAESAHLTETSMAELLESKYLALGWRFGVAARPAWLSEYRKRS